ncbi:hypothetical protein COLO4_13135 [Corchorus olitorius]|uniref:Bet v I/Major latex protein domain-containing protein n=1 Tax=Corchorus olitorius TaxID=93759 RepID=A0A1R3JY03_9ROSI|nr:hypothetical protein COLO4_13135 [Corchorus olitorius]
MAQIAKMHVQAEVKSSAEKFYDIYRNKLHLMPKISPREFKEGKVIQGDWRSVGSVRVWSYVASGNVETVKETIEAVDDESKTITVSIVEGDVKKYYKSFKSTINVLPSASGQGSLVKWTLEFEKRNENIPDPTMYTDFLVNWSKSVDSYLLNA